MTQISSIISKPENQPQILLKQNEKINWGQRRATIISVPKEPIQISLVMNSNQEITGQCEKFEIQIKNKTKWPWKKGCQFSLDPYQPKSNTLYEIMTQNLFEQFNIQIKFPVKGDQQFKLKIDLNPITDSQIK